MSDIEKRCVECGTEVPTISETPLCSKSCQIEYAHRMIREMGDQDAWCPTCHQKFDSIKDVCYHHNKSHNFDIHRNEICQNCGERFNPSSTTNNSKYCSEKCFGEDKRVELKDSSCKNCGELFTQYPSENREFCSTSCSTSNEFHWNWSGGSDDIRQTKEYKEWREAVHNKYNCCQECGSLENLHAHHIIPVSENKEIATSVENGTLLCGECHSSKHQNMANELFMVIN